MHSAVKDLRISKWNKQMIYVPLIASAICFSAVKQLFWQVNAYGWLTLIASCPSTDCSIRVRANAADEAERHPGQQQQQQQRWEAECSTVQPQKSCNTSQRSVYEGLVSDTVYCYNIYSSQQQFYTLEKMHFLVRIYMTKSDRSHVCLVKRKLKPAAG